MDNVKNLENEEKHIRLRAIGDATISPLLLFQGHARKEECEKNKEAKNH